ncbi:hypothetical protein AVEN_160877-1 [Araneus ventricosus]|uniref:Uncharacterized protein n=1 Tax=Araneus ventricosus TaxID=182803 RepID=A0A4Y2NX46_ARAVE|nr:hypothetical protein AVEN_160877-1 [Araneus ventricosus]
MPATAIPTFKTGPSTRSDFCTPLPSRFTMCGFFLVRDPWPPFPMVVFQFCDPTRQIENERSWISKLFPGLRRFASEFCIDEGFSSEAFQMAWSTLLQG